ncbi:MAG: DMT family transporter [Planctomycetota bacterium]|nr:DMT family transporter [Planctomycetota bacterium]
MGELIPYIQTRTGEIAAIGTALCWVLTSLTFAAAGRRIGSVAVNLIRTLLALVILLIVHRMVFGLWIPELDSKSVIYLACSGVIGLAIGDQFFFTALVDIGSRMTTILSTLAPPVAALLAWPILDEPLGWLAILGIAVTILGIAWVVVERPEGSQTIEHLHRIRGTIFGVLAGICQAVGLILAKLGMGHTRTDVVELVNPWTVTLVRMAFASIGICILAGGVFLFQKRRQSQDTMAISSESEHLPPSRHEVDRATLRRQALAFVLMGTIFGPVVGVWLSMVAVDQTSAGIAATLMALSPVFILPFAVWIEKERLSWRAVVGALVAVAGVVLLASIST